jgi:Na+/phosphate symporter
MSFKFLRGDGGERLESVEAKVQQMLHHVRDEFELAMSGLMGDVVAQEVNEALRATDQKVNQLEREIRRELVVHVSVFGSIDTPAVLVHMSIVKDVERIGDYCKNLLDLGRDGANFSGTTEVQEWRRLTAQISTFIIDVGHAFQSRDEERANQLLRPGGEMLPLFDRHVSALVSGADTGAQAVARALAYRYLKRIVAHLMNVLSAVVMPVHKLDYFDEDPEDR